MSIIKSPILSFTTLFVLSNCFTLKAIAQEPNFNFPDRDRVSTFAFIKNGLANSKLDYPELHLLADAPLNLEHFCQNYPYNSACKNETVPNQENTPSEVEPKRFEISNNNSWAIIPDVSTLGFGGSIVGRITPNFNGRIGVNAFGFDIDYEETRGSYDSDVTLFNVATALDYYPFKASGFHTSIGVIYTNNNADGVASASSVFDIDVGGFNIAIDDLVDINADVTTSRNFAPYLGIGWGNPIAKNWGIWANLGVMFPGSPEVELSTNYKFDENLIPEDIRQDIQDGLDREERDIEDDLDRFNVYPVISIGLTYSF